MHTFGPFADARRLDGVDKFTPEQVRQDDSREW
jgi:hypothetical protein